MRNFDEDKALAAVAKLERVRKHVDLLSRLFPSAAPVKVVLGTHPYRSFYHYRDRTIKVGAGPHFSMSEADTACHEFSHHLVNLQWSTRVSPHGLEFCQMLRDVANRFYVGAPERYNWDGEYVSVKAWWMYEVSRKFDLAAQKGRRPAVARPDYDSLLEDSGL